MKFVHCLKYSWCIIYGKAFWVITGMVSIGFFCLLVSLNLFIELNSELSKPLELRYSINEAYDLPISEIKLIKGVQEITEYHENIYKLQYKGYGADVKIVGYSNDYLEDITGQELPPSQTIPYIIIEETLLNSMKNDEEKYLEISDQKTLILEDVIIINGNNYQKCRIVGIVAKNEKLTNQEQNKQSVVYTDLKGYSMIDSSRTENLSVSINSNNQSFVEQYEENNSIRGTEKNYLICLSNGYNIEQILALLDNYGLVNNSELNLEEYISFLNDIKQQGIRVFCISMLIYICATFLLYYQSKFSQQNNRDFWEYIQIYDSKNKYKKYIIMGSVFLYYLCGSAIGTVIWGINFIAM